jgi:cation diffusion facilitator CzcD-associated flavoprotein CzcO
MATPITTVLHRVEQTEATEVEVLILGAGVSGIAAAVACLRAGHDDVVIVERAHDVGGTWLHNTYPGCAVDIPTQVYSFSYAPNPDWSRFYAPQREILDYLRRVADDFGVRPKLRLGTELLAATWDERAQRWQVRTSDGDYRARTFVSAPGPLHEPFVPDLPGLDTFTGRRFHSAQWPADLDLAGQRVVVLGTGPSALQFVPAIQPEVASLHLLQRTAAWVVPKVDWRTTRLERSLLRHVPGASRVTRALVWAFMDAFFSLMIHHPRAAQALAPVGRWHLRRAIDDPTTRELLTPDYTPTCKRLGLSNDYYRALGQPNVAVRGATVDEVRPGAVVTSAGEVIEADVLIFGTGFRTVQTHPINDRIVGRAGHTLQQEWRGNPTAYLGTTVAGFPNAFFMFGPNAGTLSGFAMAEAQAIYLVGALDAMRRADLGVVDVLPDRQDAFVADADRRLAGTTWAAGGCASYYLSHEGARVTLPWPRSMTALRRHLRRFDVAAYRCVPDVGPAAPATVGAAAAVGRIGSEGRRGDDRERGAS